MKQYYFLVAYPQRLLCDTNINRYEYKLGAQISSAMNSSLNVASYSLASRPVCYKITFSVFSYSDVSFQHLFFIPTCFEIILKSVFLTLVVVCVLCPFFLLETCGASKIVFNFQATTKKTSQKKKKQKKETT